MLLLAFIPVLPNKTATAKKRNPMSIAMRDAPISKDANWPGVNKISTISSPPARTKDVKLILSEWISVASASLYLCGGESGLTISK